MTTPLTREQILGCEDIKLHPVNVPEWGGEVFVRPWSGSESRAVRDQYKKYDEDDYLALDVVFSVCDADGNLIFTVDDIPMLNKKHAGALLRISERMNAINGVEPLAVQVGNSSETANSDNG